MCITEKYWHGATWGVDVKHRTIDLHRETPAVEVAAIVAELKETDPLQLTPITECVGDVLDPLFSTPPTADAQVLISFNYEGYHISIDQEGDALFVPVET